MKALYALALLCLFATSSLAQISSLRELMPPPKVAYLTNNADTARLYLPSYIQVLTPSKSLPYSTQNALQKMTGILHRAFKVRHNSTSVVTTPYDGTLRKEFCLIAALKGDDEDIDKLIDLALPPGEKLEHAEGYLIHSTPQYVLLAGVDTGGLLQACMRFTELWAGGNKYLPAHILDYPDYPNRWAFSMHNMRGANAVNVIKNILDTIQRYHYNGMQQNDFKYSILEEQPDFYFKNADTIITHATERGIAMIPGVAPMGYSEGILWHDRNLAEGFPANAKYIIESDTARLIPDPPVNIANGGFENVNGNGAFTGFGFYDNENGATTADASIKHSGAQSARVTDPVKANPSGNARFSLPIVTKPNKYYYLSAWVRTENVDRGEFRVLAIGADQDKPALSLTHTAFNVPSTTDKSKNGGWVRLGVLFNSQAYSKMNVYCGVWGGNKGTIWWDDFKIEEAGFVNILRRDGTPLTIERPNGEVMTEEQDFLPLHDSIMLKQSVLYDWHQAPTLRRIASGKLENGDTVTAHYYHAFTVINDVDGYGEVMACPSDEGVLNVVKDQIDRVSTLHRSPSGFMLGHDEIRHMNWDDACMSRNMSAAQILGDNVTKIHDYIASIAPNADQYAWSDMFDSLHNAVNNYYAVRGDLTGSWNYIPKDITILNWNNGNMRKSLDFFAQHGFAQMSAPYYDQGNTINMREWRLAQQTVPNVKGMMYTTWSADYSHLRPFGYYAWGAGPYIIHKPIDSLGASMAPVFLATVTPDPFDASDRITSVRAVFTLASDNTTQSVELGDMNNDMYAYPLQNGISSYKIVATNKQGLVRETPTYTFASSGNAGVSSETVNGSSNLYPNPTADLLVVREGEILRVLSLSGAEMIIAESGAKSLNVSSLTAGAYLAEIRNSDGSIRTVKFVKR